MNDKSNDLIQRFLWHSSWPLADLDSLAAATSSSMRLAYKRVSVSVDFSFNPLASASAPTYLIMRQVQRCQCWILFQSFSQCISANFANMRISRQAQRCQRWIFFQLPSQFSSICNINVTFIEEQSFCLRMVCFKGCKLGGYLIIMGKDKGDQTRSVFLNLSKANKTYWYHANSNTRHWKGFNNTSLFSYHCFPLIWLSENFKPQLKTFYKSTLAFLSHKEGKTVVHFS